MEKKNTILLPNLEKEILCTYTPPKRTILHVRKEINNSKELEGTEVLTYNDIFGIGPLKHIYIQGNPGMGKSTYCTKLTLDWCESLTVTKDSEEKEVKKKLVGLDFDFLFLISLRECSDKICGVFQMVKKAIISQLSFLQYTDDFLSAILETERCLYIFDGLDEWLHPKWGACEITQKNIPHRAYVRNCVFLTLTRPWKLNQISLKDSEIDVLLEISGVRDSYELIDNVLTSLNGNEDTPRCVEFFTGSKYLSDLKSIPILAIQLVCIWNDIRTKPSSLASIYCEMTKMMLERKKVYKLFSNPSFVVNLPKRFHSQEWSISEKLTLEHLRKLAFETLFLEDGHPSLDVFNDVTVKRHMGDEMKMAALSAGLLTEYKIRSLNQKKSQLSFLHKTFQEFLASFYLSLSTEQNKELVSRVKIQGEIINDISQLFIFICGMAPTLATSVSQDLMEATTRFLKKNRDESRSKSFVKNITELLNNGYTECIQNGHDNVCLHMTHIYCKCGYPDTDTDDHDGDDNDKKIKVCVNEKLLQQNVKRLETVWCYAYYDFLKMLGILNSSSKTITTLCLPFVDRSLDLNMCSVLQALIIPYNDGRPTVCLDLSKCQDLEYIDIGQTNLAVNINTNQLKYCNLKFCDLSQGNIVETLTKRNRKLRHLTLKYLTLPRVNSGESKSFHLDLTSCSSLGKLDITPRSGDVITVSINTTDHGNLTLCW